MHVLERTDFGASCFSLLSEEPDFRSAIIAMWIRVTFLYVVVRRCFGLA